MPNELKNNLENLSSRIESIVNNPEKIIEQEFKPENNPEKINENYSINSVNAPAQINNDHSSPQVNPSKTKKVVEIEKILEEDLSDIYFNLPVDKKQEFKRKGEETAFKINILLSETKVKVKKIIELIKNWLLIIPGINKFFLEQEAKIKTDKLLKENSK